MSQKAFVAEYTVRAIIMANDESEAHIVADAKWREIKGEERPSVDVVGELKKVSDLPDGWDLQCIPYGGDGNTRLAELVPTLST